MSDYVSMKTIKLKNDLMTPSVIKAYQNGTLDFKTLQNTFSPLAEIYANTYQYLQYPILSEEAENLVKK